MLLNSIETLLPLYKYLCYPKVYLFNASCQLIEATNNRFEFAV